MKKSNYVHALLWASAVVVSFYLETFWYAKIRYIREVSFFDYRLTIIAVSMLIFTISMLLIYKIQERKSKKNMSKEKQIEEMAEDIGKSDFCKHLPKELCNKRSCSQCTAEIIYEAGYRKQSEWISVEERLPEENGYYLVYTKYGYIEVERYKTWDDDDLDGGYWWEFEGRVTHWMPLPEAPKGGEE